MSWLIAKAIVTRRRSGGPDRSVSAAAGTGRQLRFDRVRRGFGFGAAGRSGCRKDQFDARGGVINEQTLSRAQLPGFIKSLRAKDTELSVLIGGDRNARYESVLQVMDELRKQGVQKVGLQVKTKQ